MRQALLGEVVQPVPVALQTEAAPVLTFKGLQTTGDLELSPPEAGRFARAMPGDLVFTKQGHVGGWVMKKVGVVPQQHPIVHVAGTLQVVRPTCEVESRWLYQWLASSAAYEVVQELVGERNGITTPVMLSIPVPLPNLAAQRSLLEQLEAHLSRVEAGDRLLKHVADRAISLSHSGRHRAFDVVVRQGAAVRDLVDVASIANGQTPKDLSSSASSHRVATDYIPFYKVGDMNNADGRWMGTARSYLSPSQAKGLRLAVRPPGTVLLPKRGGAIATNKKRVLRESACYDLNTMGLIPGAELSSEYLWHWLQTVDLGRLADGSNVPQINAPQIRSLKLPVPTLEVQARVSAELDELDIAVSRLKGSVDSGQVPQLRAKLLARAFSGSLFPGAHALLEA